MDTTTGPVTGGVTTSISVTGGEVPASVVKSEEVPSQDLSEDPEVVSAPDTLNVATPACKPTGNTLLATLVSKEVTADSSALVETESTVAMDVSLPARPLELDFSVLVKSEEVTEVKVSIDVSLPGLPPEVEFPVLVKSEEYVSMDVTIPLCHGDFMDTSPNMTAVKTENVSVAMETKPQSSRKITGIRARRHLKRLVKIPPQFPTYHQTTIDAFYI